MCRFALQLPLKILHWLRYCHKQGVFICKLYDVPRCSARRRGDASYILSFPSDANIMKRIIHNEIGSPTLGKFTNLLYSSRSRTSIGEGTNNGNA
jgi:hypothetical protein